MAVTTRTANDIIRTAYQILGLDAEDKNLPGKRVTTGLYHLNMIMDSYSTEPLLIAYDSQIQFSLIPGQNDYVISDQVASDVTNRRLTQIKFINILDGSNRYPCRVETDAVLFNFQTYTELSKRPEIAFLQNAVGKSTVSFISKPDRAYECIIKGKFILDHMELDTEITQVPIGYHRFLQYQLASDLSTMFAGSNWTAKDEDVLAKLKENLMSTNDQDLTLTPDHLFVGNRLRAIRPNALHVN